MKTFHYFCALTLFLSFLPFPIEYYFFLRIIITLGAITILLKEYKHGITVWFILFISIAILFNPIFPIYLGLKSLWLPFDIITGILFMLYIFRKHKVVHKKEPKNKEQITYTISHKNRSRDRFPNA